MGAPLGGGAKFITTVGTSVVLAFMTVSMTFMTGALYLRRHRVQSFG
jgi:hypothetical protein